MADFVHNLNLPPDGRSPGSEARASLESHLMAFAAEEARLDLKTINLKNYRSLAEG